MCGRYVTPSQAEMERYWELTSAQVRNPFGQLFNVSPAATIPILRKDRNGLLELVAARWGLIPFWWKEDKPLRQTFNARSEEAVTQAIWRIPLDKARCIVPALGWYEWKEVERADPATGDVTKSKQIYYIHRQDRNPIAFAGLMSWRPVEGTDQYSCSIMTRDAIGPVSEIHHRMPVALPKDTEAAWLELGLTDAATANEWMRGSAITDFAYHPVNSRLNGSSYEGTGLTESFANPA
jgi:putative SOS response-associated peptidase YedK